MSKPSKTNDWLDDQLMDVYMVAETGNDAMDKATLAAIEDANNSIRALISKNYVSKGKIRKVIPPSGESCWIADELRQKLLGEK
jgi:hypothetical protein